jgi:glycerophosphoryl diester phosphodiesterase
MPPFVIAHRGDSAHRPENTLASFASALELGAQLVEFDVRLTRDRHVVVLHDPTLDRTTNGHGAAADMTLEEIRSFSAGYPELFGDRFRGERVPTLAETLAFLRDRSRAMIELKADSAPGDLLDGLEARTIEEIRKAGMERETVLISFYRDSLLRCRQLAPDIMRGHLFEQASPQEVVDGARAVGSELVMPEKGMLSDALRDRAREAGLKVATWVVDDPDELRALARFDLYGVGSNSPGLLLDAARDV